MKLMRFSCNGRFCTSLFSRLVKFIPGLLCLVIASNVLAEILDVREEMARESVRYRARHFPDGNMPPKHDWRGKPPTRPEEVPGGIGYGMSFGGNALLWSSSTVADYYVIAPTVLDGYTYTLYLTATCRSQLTTESLIEYAYTGEAQFWIYDWSQPAATRWQVMIDLPTSNPQYLTNRPDEFAVTRQMVHIQNGTYLLGNSGGLYQWENRVMLFNFSRGDWDYIYSSGYSTTNLTDNVFTNGAGVGWWGPIAETFETYTNVNPVGFDLIRLFQDGKPQWLTLNNSYTTQSSPWQLLDLAPDTSFTVAVSSSTLSGSTNQVGTLCVTANTNTASFSLNPPVAAGLISPYWIETPYSNRWDKTVVGLSPGTYTITFNAAPGLVTPPQQTFTILSNSITTVQTIYTTNVADTPIALTGYNLDVVVPNTATGGNTAPYAQPFNPSAANTFYEAGLGDIGSWSYGDGSEGLPQTGFFSSLLDGATTFQLAPYTSNNVLYLKSGSAAGTFNLAVPAVYDSLSVLAASANGGGNGSFVIHFVNKTSSHAFSYNASDWWSYSAGSALTGFGLVLTGDYGVFYTQDPTNLPNLYQTSISLAALGLNTIPIASVTFAMPNGAGTSTNTVTGIFALSGTLTPPVLQMGKKTNGNFNFSWNAVSNRSYQVQYKTNLSQVGWFNLGSSFAATNYLMTVSDVIGSQRARFYRVVLLP